VRIAGKGLINREKTVNFKFDGRSYKGFEGDTVASALLASGKNYLAAHLNIIGQEVF
tara:strand:- start:497 stop:667 length:171 start_codon:yes stop_codon:yes gene_type:complete